jgi:hypothetical protein
MVEGKTCRILREEHVGFDNSFQDTSYIVYEDSGEVYFLYVDGFHLLYNFNAAPGDTISVINEEFSGFIPFQDNLYPKFIYAIDSIYTTEISGITLKTQLPSTSLNSEDWGFGYDPIIEKIGSTNLFFGLSNALPTSFWWYFRCYEDAEIFYKNEYYDFDCDYLTSLENLNLNPSINVYPNPFSNKFYVKSSQFHLLTKISVSDLLGRIILMEDLEYDNVIEFNLSNQADGLYTITINTTDNIYSTKILKH